MTLTLAAATPGSIWMLVDRRISYGPARRPRDNARKMLEIVSVDGVALLGYAGLGETAGGMEPCDWMANVLRDVNLPLEEQLQRIANATFREFPPHLNRLRTRFPQSSHSVLVAAFLRGAPRIYSIDIVTALGTGATRSRFTRHARPAEVDRKQSSPLIMVGGSGAAALLGASAMLERPLVKVLKAHDRGAVSAGAVAKMLADINERAARRTADRSVGHRCKVVWRLRDGGGAFQLFSRGQPEVEQEWVTWPAIVHGMDERQIFDATWRFHLGPWLDAKARRIEPPPEASLS